MTGKLLHKFPQLPGWMGTLPWIDLRGPVRFHYVVIVWYTNRYTKQSTLAEDCQCLSKSSGCCLESNRLCSPVSNSTLLCTKCLQCWYTHQWLSKWGLQTPGGTRHMAWGPAPLCAIKQSYWVNYSHLFVLAQQKLWYAVTLHVHLFAVSQSHMGQES